MRGLIVAAILAAEMIIAPVQHPEPQTVRCTCYLPTGHLTADGTEPYEGIIASSRDHLGDIAMLYTLEGNYIGMYECRDIGGHYMLRNGTAIDVYRDSMEAALEWVEEYGDYVQVLWIEAEG